jgi:hypothetical protein
MLNKVLHSPNFKVSTVVTLLFAISAIIPKEYLEIGIRLPI